MRLHALDRLLQPILADCVPVVPESRKTAEALGLVLASAVRAPTPVPRHAVALRDGLAVCAADLVGASPSSPVILGTMPASVHAGDGLPPGCDAVLDPELAIGGAPFVEIIEMVAPGTHVRFPGHDLAAGAVIAPGGARFDASLALICDVAGVERVEVRVPRVAIELADAAVAAWLGAELRRLGCRVAGADETADLRLRGARDSSPRLAIRPGETGWIEQCEGEIVIEVPDRFDGAIGVFAFLALPILARLSGVALCETVLPLSAKIASTIGSSDLVLLMVSDAVFRPLAVGDLPLRAVGRASHFLVVPPGHEGLDVGASVAAISFAEPFAGRSMPQERPSRNDQD